jgi:alanyl-tRNA synthetase
MLGNWSIGQDKNGKYFKEEAIKYALEFFVDELKLNKNKFYITIFKGDKNIPKDEESEKIWMENGIPEEKIKEFGAEDNFWGPAGEIGPCGPCSEIHYDRGEKFGCGKSDCGPNCPHCQRFVEIWNLVFMEYQKKLKVKSEKLKIEEIQKPLYEYTRLPKKNVDTGIGFERLAAILQNKSSVYETDLFFPIIQEIICHSRSFCHSREGGNPLLQNNKFNIEHKTTERKSKIISLYEKDKKSYRIIADHLRGAAFLISEGILPSNLVQGYVLRRILRRSIRYAKVLNLPENWYVGPIKKISEIYGEIYPEILSKENEIIKVIKNEEEKFGKALEKGLKFLKDNIEAYKQFNKTTLEEYKQELPFKGGFAFYMYETYGFSPDLTLEELKKDSEIREKINEKEYWDHFNRRMKEHQEISRAGAEKKFGGHGMKKQEAESRKPKAAVKLHTATHLLHQALREVLGEDVKQMGSDINKERLRFDFSYSQKMTSEQIKKVEEIVNQKIKEDLPIKMEEMDYQKAIASGALAFFREKYPSRVKVYSIGDPSANSGQVFSKEICAGPHINYTGELGIFKIQKEKSSSAGVRRIKAVLK